MHSVRHFLAAVFVILFVAPAHSADISPCSTEGEIAAPNSLGTHNRRTFHEGRDEYPVEIFSIGGKNTSSWGSFCLRYEIFNISKKTIPLFYWDLVTAREAYDLVADERRKRVHQRPSQFSDLVVGKTKLKAFRVSEIEAEVKRTVEDTRSSSLSMVPNAPKLHAVNVKTEYPGLASYLAASHLPAGILLAYSTGSETAALPPLADALETRFGAVQTSSTARYDEKGWTMSTRILVSPWARITPAVFAPAALAMQKSEDPTQFVKNLEAFRNQELALERGGTGFTAHVTKFEPKRDQRLFVVEHPVTIRWGENSDCIRVASFSPFPIEVGETYCR